MTIISILSSLTILAMIYIHRATLGEVDCISDNHTILPDRSNSCHIIIILQCGNDILQRCDVDIHLIAEVTKCFKGAPCRENHRSAVSKSNNHILSTFCGIHRCKQRVTIHAILSIGSISSI